ncbi:MAG: 4'-phosphopantetheinyl transferase superfamily protein [Candidatus Aureabacteria bacterium]|nr:4'-phosphopantetheinyl transferase superfamily protein [Candidatus Auribacterota bacterium]
MEVDTGLSWSPVAQAFDNPLLIILDHEPANHLLGDPVIEVCAARIPEIVEASIFYELMSYLPEAKQAAIKKFVKRHDTQRALVSEILIRSIICRTLKMKNSEIEYVYNNYGKPSLKNRPDFYFNLSHSGEWAVCTVDKEPIGIDVEQIRPIEAIDLGKRFFSKGEYDDLLKRSESTRLRYFYDLWTLKESYIKAWGKGIFTSLDSFTVRMHSDGEITLHTDNEFKKCFFKQYRIGDNYTLSVCATNKRFPDSVIINSLNGLCQDMQSA